MKFISFITLFSLISISHLLQAQSMSKIAMHLDRTEYFPGDTILFKGYIVSDGVLDSATRNIYIDWADEQGDVLESNVYVVVDGVFAAQYLVPKNYSENRILLNAFTKNTVDFPNFIYDRTIAIYQKERKTTVKEEIGQLPELIVYPKIKHMLLHESVGFLFKNPVNSSFKGQIKTADGKVVEELESDQNGEASVFLTPESTGYLLEWQMVNGGKIKTALPTVVDHGYKITVGESIDKYKLIVSKVGKVNDAVIVRAYLDHHRLFDEKVEIPEGQDVKTLVLQKEGLANGILQFLLYDVNSNLLQKEGLIAKNKEAIITPEVTFVNRSSDPLGKNLLRVELPEGELANVSVSITDNAFPVDSSSTVVSDLLFKNIAKKTYEDQFVQDISKDERYIAALSRDEFTQVDKAIVKTDDILLLSGKIELKEKDKKKIEKTLDNRAEKGKTKRGISFGYQGAMDPVMRYMEVPFDNETSFKITDYVPFDSVQIRVTQVDDKMRFIPFKVNYSFYDLPKTNILRSIPNKGSLWINPELDKNPLLDDFRTRYMETLLKRDITKLDTVKISRKAINEQRVKTLNDKYARSGLFSKDGRGIDIQGDKDAAGSFNLFTYLQLGKIAGLQIISQPMTNVPTVKFKSDIVAYYINEIETTAEEVSYLGMNEIAYVKVIEGPTPTVTRGPVVAVYTLPTSEVVRDRGRLVDLQKVKGYTSLRPFQSVNENLNLNGFGDRITLYWNPLLIYYKNVAVKEIEFFNNNRAGKVQVTIQGITKSGRLVYFQKVM